jgi:hypothetical protein
MPSQIPGSSGSAIGATPCAGLSISTAGATIADATYPWFQEIIQNNKLTSTNLERSQRLQ